MTMENCNSVAVLIGNSDDRLGQAQWAQYVSDVGVLFRVACFKVHFEGFPAADGPWQNACWVGEIEHDKLPELRDELRKARTRHNQDAAALIVAGAAEMI
jgi:hypothetical protein